MNKITIKTFWFLCVGLSMIFLNQPTVTAKEITINSEEQLEFVLILIQKDHYEEAVYELQRFMFFFPSDPHVPRVIFLMGLCQVQLRRFDEARKTLLQVIRSYPEDSVAVKALFLIGESHYRQGAPEKAEPYFTKVIENYPKSDLRNLALYRLGWTQMDLSRWEEASEFFKKVESTSPFYVSSQALARASLEGDMLPQKDPTTAGALAVLPGLGHLYVGRKRDATIAFVLNGLCIWAAVEAFRQDHYALGGILTFIEIGFYSGNIYSAVNVAHKHNRQVKKRFLNSLGDRLDINLLAGRQNPLGFAITWRF
jgi:tetratricopeptide (TPR) repeat protein